MISEYEKEKIISYKRFYSYYSTYRNKTIEENTGRIIDKSNKPYLVTDTLILKFHYDATGLINKITQTRFDNTCEYEVSYLRN